MTSRSPLSPLDRDLIYSVSNTTKTYAADPTRDELFLPVRIFFSFTTYIFSDITCDEQTETKKTKKGGPGGQRAVHASQSNPGFANKHYQIKTQ